MHGQQTRRKRLAVHTGSGNETFCRRATSAKGLFFTQASGFNSWKISQYFQYLRRKQYGIFMERLTVHHMAAGRNVCGRLIADLPGDREGLRAGPSFTHGLWRDPGEHPVQRRFKPDDGGRGRDSRYRTVAV